MARETDNKIKFIVEYEDGRTAVITIDRFTLGRGDYIAQIIASEWQKDGRIPKGTIARVKRAPHGF